MDLRDRVVLLTGGRRIGAAVASDLALVGADVALTYSASQDAAEATAEAVRSAGRRAMTRRVDVSDPAACAALVADVERELGRLDVLVFMASIYERVAFDDLDMAAFDRQLSVDLRGAFACASAAVPAMRRQGGGRIILFSDWVAASSRPRYPGYTGYYVAKAGAKALAETMALELAADGILVNTVAPGPIVAPPGTSEVEDKAVLRATPLGRWGGPGEIVKAVRLLIDSDFITGETIRVDGGRHIK
jgi:NAD(P)-dependent dehydrogenase (short-subunit alcohol dehydrogenase family)